MKPGELCVRSCEHSKQTIVCVHQQRTGAVDSSGIYVKNFQHHFPSLSGHVSRLVSQNTPHDSQYFQKDLRSSGEDFEGGGEEREPRGDAVEETEEKRAHLPSALRAGQENVQKIADGLPQEGGVNSFLTSHPSLWRILHQKSRNFYALITTSSNPSGACSIYQNATHIGIIVMMCGARGRKLHTMTYTQA